MCVMDTLIDGRHSLWYRPAILLTIARDASVMGFSRPYPTENYVEVARGWRAFNLWIKRDRSWHLCPRNSSSRWSRLARQGFIRLRGPRGWWRLAIGKSGTPLDAFTEILYSHAGDWQGRYLGQRQMSYFFKLSNSLYGQLAGPSSATLPTIHRFPELSSQSHEKSCGFHSPDSIL